MFTFEWFSCPDGITPIYGLTGLNNTIYICVLSLRDGSILKRGGESERGRWTKEKQKRIWDILMWKKTFCNNDFLNIAELINSAPECTI